MTKKPCFVIAEAGVNHNGSFDLALKLADVAKESGADAVKYQTFRAEALTTKEAKKADYQSVATGGGESQQDMLKKLELTYDQFAELKGYCESIGIEFMSTPFDEGSADFLNSIGMRRFKIPSGEATNPVLIKHIASFGKPIILSTGMCSLGEVEQAIQWVRRTGNDADLWVLHCVSAYPAGPETMNLRAMQTMSQAFDIPIGFSDHSLGIHVSIAAAALGACCIEKHYTLDKTMAGPDHQASLEPNELTQMIAAIRDVEASLGDGVKRMMPNEENTAAVARKSWVAARDLAAGSVLRAEDLVLKRPGTGIPGARADELIGRTLRTAIPEDTMLDWGMIS